MALLGLVVLAVLGDGAARRHETGQLFDRVAAAQASLTYADRRLAGLVAYTSPQLSSPDAPPAVRQSLRAVLQDEAADRLPPLATRRDAVAGVRLLPWHGEERQARDDYLAYLDLRQQALREAAADLDVLYQRRPKTTRARERAWAALRRLGSGGQQARVDELLR